MTYRMLYSELNTITNRMYDLQEQAATGKRMNEPSDDPAVIKPMLNYRVESRTTSRYLTHMGFAQDRMEILDSNLGRLENLMVQAQETGIRAMNGAASEADRAVYAEDISHIYEEMLQIANTKENGEYSFAGYQDETVPFTENADYDPEQYDPKDASTWAVTYHGDANCKAVEIAPGELIETGLNGSELFLGDTDNDLEKDAAGTDLFSTLKNFEHAIRIDDQEGMAEGLQALQDGANQARRLRGRMGNNVSQIVRATGHLELASNEIKEAISTYEDADVIEVYTNLAKHETSLKAALNVTSKVSKLTILDYM
jgi:flagellar hook-associated protein 3 FlgL